VPRASAGAGPRARATKPALAASALAVSAVVALALSPLSPLTAQAAPGSGSYTASDAFPWDQQDALTTLDASSRLFYSVSPVDGVLRVADLDSGDLLDELDLAPWGSGGDVVVDEGTGRLFVGTGSGDQVVAYDPSDGSLQEWAVGRSADDLDVDEENGLVLVASTTGMADQNAVTVLSSDDGEIVRSVPTPWATGLAVAASGQVYVTTSSDVARWSTGLAAREAHADVATGFGQGDTVVVDDRTGRLFVRASPGADEQLFVLDASSLRVLGTPDVGGTPREMAVDQSTDTVYVASSTDVTVLDGATGKLVTTVTGSGQGQSGRSPVTGLVVDEAENALFYLSPGRVVASVRGPVSFDTTAPSGVVTVGGRVDERLSGRGAGVSYEVASGSLPPGVTLSRDGRLTGTATRAGTFRAEVVATSSTGDTVRKVVERTVAGVDRLQGGTRYETSAAVSRRAYPDGAATVFVASGATFPDALAAGPVAARQGAPLLLSAPDALSAATATEITRLGARRVVIVGGEASLHAAVERAAKALPGVTQVSRAQGPDRYATARALAAMAGPSTDGTVFVATGRAFPDALSASAAAGALDAPLLLVEGGATGIDAETRAALSTLRAERIVVVGGPAVVSDALFASLPGDVVRAAGADRFETSVVVSSLVPESTGRLVLAAGTNFPDALAASAWAGHEGHVLSISLPDCVPAVVLDAAGARGTSSVTLVGGPATLSSRVESLTPCS